MSWTVSNLVRVLALDARSLRRVLLAAIAPVALALAPAPADAEFAALAASAQSMAGPAFAGSEVVWGERTPPGVAPSSFSIYAAVPGSHGSTLVSEVVPRAGEEINPMGLVTSSTRVAFAYEVENNCLGPAFSCSVSSEYIAAFDAPVGGPFHRVVQLSLANAPSFQYASPPTEWEADVGLSGEELVLAEPVNKGAGGEKVYVQDLATGAPSHDVG
jgi:hypothetical protein